MQKEVALFCLILLVNNGNFTIYELIVIGFIRNNYLMLEYLFEPYNTPFLYAFYFMLGIMSLEILSLLAGLGLSEIIDNLFDATDVGLDVEADADFDIEGDADVQSSFISKYIAWIKVKNVPMLILLIIFLASFSITGFIGQSLLNRFADFTLPSLFAVPAAMILGFPAYKYIAKALGENLFREETTALLEKSFIGEVAEINIGTARKGLPAEAKFKDKFGQLHYFLVEPEDEDDGFVLGTKVELTGKEQNTFKAIRIKQ